VIISRNLPTTGIAWTLLSCSGMILLQGKAEEAGLVQPAEEKTL